MEVEYGTALIQIKPEADITVTKLYDEAMKLCRYAEARVITVDEDVKSATNDLAIIANRKKTLEEKRKGYTGPINDHLKAVNAAFQEFTAPLNQADQVNRQKVLDYRKAQEAIIAEQERINRLRIEAAEAEMELKGELTESVDLVEVSPETPKRVSTDMGTVGQRDNWKYEVVDFALVPDEYKMINAGVLTPVVKASKGKIIIPGIRIFNEPGLTVNVR